MKLFDTAATAEKLGISAGRLRQLRIDGRISGIRFGNSWAYTHSEIESYTPRPTGRPKSVRVHKKPRKREVSDVEQEALRSLGGDSEAQESQKGGD